MSVLNYAKERYQAYLSLGSNIAPYQNLPLAIGLLRHHSPEMLLSRTYETIAVGSDGPNFLNLAAGFVTPLQIGELKEQVLRSIEQSLGRVRTADKFAPRTIDLDITVFNGLVIEPEIWRRIYLALPLSELLPDIVDPITGRSLREVAQQLVHHEPVIPHPEITFQ